MAQSFAKNAIHIVFSTKHREPWIHPSIEHELHNYLGGTCNRLESPVIAVGGVDDHVHILCYLSRKMALMKLVEEIKTHSSKWIKTVGPAYEQFYWQRGYGAFSVNPTDLSGLIQYIRNQRIHHTQCGFQDEYRQILRQHAIEYDERYVWD